MICARHWYCEIPAWKSLIMTISYMISISNFHLICKIASPQMIQWIISCLFTRFREAILTPVSRENQSTPLVLINRFHMYHCTCTCMAGFIFLIKRHVSSLISPRFLLCLFDPVWPKQCPQSQSLKQHHFNFIFQHNTTGLLLKHYHIHQS